MLIRESQYDRIQSEGLNLSGLVRDLIDDRFSHRRVVLAVDPTTRQLYDKAISNFGATDGELERFFIKALDDLLALKGEEIQRTRDDLKKRGN